MIRKSVSIAVLSALAVFAASPAFALNNPGFEDGVGANPVGWFTPSGTLTSVASGTSVSVIDDAYFPAPTEIYNVAIDAMSGDNFGLLETCPAAVDALDCPSSMAFSVNLGGPVSNYGDVLWLRLLTADYVGSNYNDSVSVSYFGTAMGPALAVDTISVQSMNPNEDPAIADSGWKGFGVPIGTNSIMVQLSGVAYSPAIPGDSSFNRPIAAVDYQAAVTPVPEAETSAMMLAGLGVLGLVARRRNRKAK